MPTTTVQKAVSLSGTGTLQVGAGTSLYLDIASPPINAECPSYLTMTPIGSTNSYFLYSYANEVTQQSTLQLSQVSTITTSPTNAGYNTATILTSLSTNYFIYDITSLSTTDNTFVAICQDTNATTETAYLVGGKIDLTQSPPVIILGNTPYQYTSVYSLSPEVIALNENSFAFAYYQTNPTAAVNTAYGKFTLYTLNTHNDQLTNTALPLSIGTLNPTDLTFSISPASSFADNNDKSIYFTLSPLTTTTYLLAYYNSYSHGIPISGPLHARIATVTGTTTTGSTASITLSDSVSQNSSALNYYISSSALDSNTVIVAYSDAKQNNALVVQAIEITSTADVQSGMPPLAYGATWTVNSGEVFTTLPTGYMDIDIATVSASDQSFVLLYSDSSNSGAMTATIGQVTLSGEVIRLSPDFLLSTSNPNNGQYHAWGALASGSTTVLDSSTAILTMFSDASNCNTNAM